MAHPNDAALAFIRAFSKLFRMLRPALFFVIRQHGCHGGSRSGQCTDKRANDTASQVGGHHSNILGKPQAILVSRIIRLDVLYACRGREVANAHYKAERLGTGKHRDDHHDERDPVVKVWLVKDETRSPKRAVAHGGQEKPDGRAKESFHRVFPDKATNDREPEHSDSK